MTQEEILEGNKLIAKFMGLVNLKEERPELFEKGFKEDYWQVGVWQDEEERKIVGKFRRSVLDANYVVTNELLYHSSWDWLMPVALKIEEITELTPDVLLAQIHTGSGKIFLGESKDDRIERFFHACIQFVEWYNNKKQ